MTVDSHGFVGSATGQVFDQGIADTCIGVRVNVVHERSISYGRGQIVLSTGQV
jgi:hypothetical protein